MIILQVNHPYFGTVPFLSIPYFIIAIVIKVAIVIEFVIIISVSIY
jgi:hypothetical protein